MSRQEEYYQRLLELNGDKYTYEKSTIIEYRKKVTYYCKIHGIRHTKLSHMLSGKGCADCALEKAREKCKKTTEDFIKKGKEVYGDLHDYSISNYIGSVKNIEVICKKHGKFKTLPYNYYRGNSGCEGCKKEKFRESRKKSPKHYIKKLHKIHGNKYDFSNSDFDQTRDFITYTCKIHGEKEAKLNNLLNGMGCNECANENHPGGYTDSLIERNKESYLQEYSNLYILKLTTNEGQEFLKIGISNNIKKRVGNIRRNSGYKVKVLDNIEGNLYHIFKKEQYLLKLYKTYQYKPDSYFHGWTECFDYTIKDKIQKKFEIFKKDHKLTSYVEK